MILKCTYFKNKLFESILTLESDIINEFALNKLKLKGKKKLSHFYL